MKTKNIAQPFADTGLLTRYLVDDRFVRYRAARRATVKYLRLLEKEGEVPAALQRRAVRELKKSFSRYPWFSRVASSLTFATFLMFVQGQNAWASDQMQDATAQKLERQVAGYAQAVDIRTAKRHSTDWLNRTTLPAGDKVLTADNQSSRKQLLHLVSARADSTGGDDFFVADSHILTVIDRSVPDWEDIYYAVSVGEILLLDQQQDPVEQILHAVSGISGVELINIVSHGRDGEITLADQRIDRHALSLQADLWQAIGQQMDADGQIQVFGCEVAKSEEGKDFINALAASTGADVAGSVDLTGDTGQNGDWTLEYWSGAGPVHSETQQLSAFNAEKILRYSNVLLDTTYNFNSFTQCNGSDWSAPYSASCTTPISDLTARAFGSSLMVGIYNSNTSNYIDSDGTTGSADKILAVGGGGVGSAGSPRYVEFRKTDNSIFTASSVDIGIWTYHTNTGQPPYSDTLTITAYDGSNAQIGSITVDPVYRDDYYLLDFTNPTAGYVRNNGFYSTAPTITASGSFASAAKVRFKINQNTFYLDDLVLSTASANNAPTNISLTSSSIDDTSTGAAATVGTLSTTDADSGDSHTYSLVTNGASGSGSCGATGDDNNSSFQISGSTLQTASSLSAGSYNICVQTNDGTDTYQKTFAITVNATANADGNLTASAAVTEPVGLDTTADTVGEAVDVFDFTLSDGGGGDGQAMDISQIVLNVSGTSNDTERGQITWRLNGSDVSNVTGSYNGTTDTITFSGLSISVADGMSETYTVNAYYNDNTNLTEDHTIILSVDGDTDITSSGGTTMGTTSAVSNSSGTTIDVTASTLVFTTQPAGSVSGSALTTQPVVTAQDAFGNTDGDFTETISLTEASAGSLSGNVATAVSGVAIFTGLAYTATADQQSFTLTANDQDGVGSDLPSVDAGAVTADVVATRLLFSAQPAPLTVQSGVSTGLTTIPVVQAVDANDIVDTGYSTGITLAEVNGAGSVTMTATGDSDGDTATVTISPASGVSTFTGLSLTYTAAGSGSETFNLQASSGGLSTSNSSQMTATNTPVVTDANISISGATGTGGVYKIGDTVTATWNNTAGGDNNSGITGVTVNFSQFGGGSSVAASESSGSWTATYVISAGSIDAGNRNVSVTASNSDGPTTTADTSNATVDNIAPTLSSSTPADNATAVQFDSTIALTFSENMSVSSGQFSVYDADGDALVESIAVTSGQVVLGGSGTTLTITPTDNWTPTHSYYLLADSGVITDSAGNIWSGISSSGGLNFTVTNNNPSGTADSASTNEDNAVAIDVLANDSDVDSGLNAASVTVTNAPAHGSTSVNTANGVVTYTPVANYNGSDSFTYSVDDIYGGNSGDVTVSITINAVNDAPVAVNDVGSTPEDTPFSVDVAANDTDVDSGDSVDSSTLTIVTQPAHGTASVVSGEIYYTPGTDYNGSDSLTYQIDDHNGATSNVATLIINISGVNDDPVAVNDSASTDEDTDVLIAVLDNDSDVDGTIDVSTVSIGREPYHGSVSIDNSNGGITYTPAADYNGADSFTYVVKDDAGFISNIATVSLIINAVNDAPVALDNSVTMPEDTGSGDGASRINVLGNDSDVDGTLKADTVELVTAPANGNATVNTDGSISYIPTADFHGSDSLSYRVQDDLGAWSNTAMITITVASVNDSPLANDDSATTDEDAAVTIDVAANDSDIDGSLNLNSIVLISDVTHGSLQDNGDGTLTYTPASDFYGSDSFSYQISDNEAGISATASVSITVNAVNDAPVISGTPASSVLEGATFSFTPAVSDVDSTSFTYSLTGQPGWMSINASTGTVTATPAVGDEGNYSGIVIVVDDGATVNNTASLAAFSLSVIGDFDTDGIANSDDTDDDNDGMSDEYEEQYGFNPYDDSDALADSDGDTISNGQEYLDDTDPTDAGDYYDVTAPVVTAPADLTIDATGLFTSVTAGMLLQGAALDSLATDNVDGANCCNTLVEGMIGGILLMRPGLHTVTYSATDNKGNTGTAEQTLRIRPLVSFSPDIQTAEGATASFRIVLNGPAPDYPLEVPYVIDSSSTADSSDYDLTDGSVTFTQGQTSSSVSVVLIDDAVAEGPETLVIRLDDDTSNSEDLASGYDPGNIDIHDINAGAASQLIITINEGNLPPTASLTLTQDGTGTVQMTRSGGLVSAIVSVTDPNMQDTHSYDWSGSDSSLIDTDGSLVNSTMLIDPSTLALGRYLLQVKVTDSAGASDIERVYFLLVDALPELRPDTDTDGDGIADADEGTGDDDNDGIPDYLDNIAATNLLPEVANNTSGYLVECDPGVRCRLGQFAMVGNNGGARLDEDELTQQQGLSPDDRYQPRGGIFDFEVHELPTLGQSVQVVIPQTAAIPANAVYRKFRNGSWETFVTDARNLLHSAPGELGYCPPPGDESWQVGLSAGYYCVQLTIEDGGPNDADGEVNAAVEDPGAVSVLSSSQPQTVNVTTSAQKIGGGLGWISLLGLAGLAAIARRTRYGSRKSSGWLHSIGLLTVTLMMSGVVSLWPADVEASEPEAAGKGYAFFAIGQAQSNISQGEFEDHLRTGGQDVTVTSYDTTRGVRNFGLGYEYLPGYAVELSYLDMGDADTAIQGTAVPDELKNLLRRYHPVGGAGWMLNQVFLFPLTDRFSLTATAGLYYWHGRVKSSADDLDVSLEGGFDPLLGLGMKYQLNERYQVGMDMKRLMFDRQQLDIWSLRAGISF